MLARAQKGGVLGHRHARRLGARMWGGGSAHVGGEGARTWGARARACGGQQAPTGTHIRAGVGVRTFGGACRRVRVLARANARLLAQTVVCNNARVLAYSHVQAGCKHVQADTRMCKRVASMCKRFRHIGTCRMRRRVRNGSGVAGCLSGWLDGLDGLFDVPAPAFASHEV
eukprot:358331-Chlamydomonas_euryale.AAC.2